MLHPVATNGNKAINSIRLIGFILSPLQIRSEVRLLFGLCKFLVSQTRFVAFHQQPLCLITPRALGNRPLQLAEAPSRLSFTDLVSHL